MGIRYFEGEVLFPSILELTHQAKATGHGGQHKSQRGKNYRVSKILVLVMLQMTARWRVVL